MVVLSRRDFCLLHYADSVAVVALSPVLYAHCLLADSVGIGVVLALAETGVYTQGLLIAHPVNDAHAIDDGHR